MKSTTRQRAGLMALATLGLVTITDVEDASGDGGTAPASVVAPAAAAPAPTAGAAPAPSAGKEEATTRGARMLGAPTTKVAGPAPAPKGPQIEPLPGFADAPGVYHHGAVDFFLGRPEQIGLTPAQRGALTRIRGKAERRLTQTDQKVTQAEEELFAMTAVSRPDAGAIAAKIGEIEALRSQQRLAFIRDVGEAARVLTDEQRALVVASAVPPVATPEQAAPPARAPSPAPAPATTVPAPPAAAPASPVAQPVRAAAANGATEADPFGDD